MERLLVTGAGGSAAANFVAALRLAPVEFFVAGADMTPFHLELASVDSRYLVPPVHDPGYLDTLNRIIDRERVDIVHAQPDPEVAFMSHHRDRIDAATYLPTADAVDLCQDKARFAAALAAAGVACPEYFHPATLQEAGDATRALLERHERAWIRAIRGAGARAALPVVKSNQATAWIRYWRDVRGLRASDFMISEFLPGREFAYQSVWKDGEPYVSQTRERLQYLFGSLVPSGQTSTPSVARTVQRPDVAELAADAVRAVDPTATGVFCADVKEDADGRPKVTEINAGRFFTTSNFFAEAGLNMPYDYVRLAAGKTIERRLEPLEPNLYWVRMVDMGYRLVRNGEWGAVRA